MTGLILALRFLTRLPLPGVVVDDAAFARSIRWFPAAGLMIGGLVAGSGWLGRTIDPWAGALFALTLWVAITGALHLDGLADIADASGAAHADKARLLAVLKDPHIGSFGVVAVVLQLIAKLILLRLLMDASLLLLVFVPFAARIGPLVWARWLPPLHEGLGARFHGAVRPLDLAIWGMALIAAAAVAPALLITPLLVLCWGWRIRRTLGGISGDGHGAGIELVETGLLLALLIWARMA